MHIVYQFVQWHLFWFYPFLVTERLLWMFVYMSIRCIQYISWVKYIRMELINHTVDLCLTYFNDLIKIELYHFALCSF